MPRVRIFLPTYRRPALLPRALESLRAQTYRDWICEVHNDDPGDPGPSTLLHRTGDSRFLLRQHQRNLGGTATFNLFFQGTAEPFYSLLEDDNWWEPSFLDEMLAAADAHPAVTIFWSNQRMWQEEPGGRFRDTGLMVRKVAEDGAPRQVPWGKPAQIFGAVHSNGAMLVRSRPGERFQTPAVPFAVIEGFRERAFPHPLVFVPRPLAHFSLTLETARSRDRGEWAAMQVLLAASFLKHARYDWEETQLLWRRAREQRPPATTTLFYASFIEPACRSLRKAARRSDWVHIARGGLRRPWIVRQVLSCRRSHPGWWDWLDLNTAARFERRHSDS